MGQIKFNKRHTFRVRINIRSFIDSAFLLTEKSCISFPLFFFLDFASKKLGIVYHYESEKEVIVWHARGVTWARIYWFRWLLFGNEIRLSSVFSCKKGKSFLLVERNNKNCWVFLVEAVCSFIFVLIFSSDYFHKLWSPGTKIRTPILFACLFICSFCKREEPLYFYRLSNFSVQLCQI